MSILVGSAAPPFTLSSGDGTEVSLKDYRGKNVIVYFYPRNDTPGCTKEACGFRDLWDEIGQRDAVVLGISPDRGDSHQRFTEKYQLPFTLLSDPDKQVMVRYGAWGEKTMYGKKTVGVIRSTVWVGPDGEVKKHWARVTNAEKHPGQVLDALREANA
jgi:peroxiredoxin Q/BCP